MFAIVDQQSADRTLIIAQRDTPETFLTSYFPYLEHERIRFIKRNSPWSEFYTDSKVVGGLETLISELEKETRFADGAIANDYELENVSVREGLLLSHL